jgi:hypothetical protein
VGEITDAVSGILGGVGATGSLSYNAGVYATCWLDFGFFSNFGFGGCSSVFNSSAGLDAVIKLTNSFAIFSGGGIIR